MFNEDHDARLVDLLTQVTNDSDASDPARLVRLAKRNDAEVPVARYLLNSDAALDEDTITDLEAILEDRQRYVRELRATDNLFESAEIDYVAIKSRMLHPICPWDLNLVVSEDDWGAATDLLEQRGWRRAGFLEHPLARTEPGKLLFKKEGRYPIHLHRHVSWNGLTYISANRVIASRVRTDGIWYPDWVTDTVIHCAHSIFENYELTLAESFQIQQVFCSRGLGGRKIAVDHGWSGGYDLALNTARQIISTIHQGDNVRLPRKYPMIPLFKAWNQHAWHCGVGPLELVAHSALRMLK